MEDQDGYAVYFFPPALEALGAAIKPFLVEGPTGAHVLCHGIDTAGSLIGMQLYGHNAAGKLAQLELMVPTNMVRMIVSARSDEAFGFGPRAGIAKIAAAGLPTTQVSTAAAVPASTKSPARKRTPAKAKPAKPPLRRPAAAEPATVPTPKPKPRKRPRP